MHGPRRAQDGGSALRWRHPTDRRPAAYCLQPTRGSRAGFTLVELLVVISILVLLAAMTIPNVRPALENRRVRETARSIEAYLNRARVDAVERHLAVGVQFVRAAGQNEACVRLQQVLVPPVYAGEDNGAVVRVQRWGSTQPVIVKILVRAGAIGQNIIRDGDMIQFGNAAWNSAAPTYVIFDDPNASNPPTYLPDFPPDPHGTDYIDFITGVHQTQYPDPGPPTPAETPRYWIDNYVLTAMLINQGVAVPWPVVTAAGEGNTFPPTATPNWSGPQQFAILRQPVPSPVAPLQLPESMCIDLYESGTDEVCFYPYNQYSPSITVMFAPNGTVQQIYGASGAVLPTDRLYFLVGRRDRLPAIAAYPTMADWFPARGASENEDGLRNWQDLNNLWISILPRSGMTVTVENSAYAAADYSTYGTPADRFNALLAIVQNARTIARTAQNMGGR